MAELENIIDDFEDIQETNDDSPALDDLEDFVNADHDESEAAIFDTSEMPDELRQEIEEIEGSKDTFESDLDVEAAHDDNNAVIDPTADYIPEDYEKIEETLTPNTSEITHDEVVNSTDNMNADMSPREIEDAPTPVEVSDNLDSNITKVEPVEAEIEKIGTSEDVATESDEVEEEYPKEEEDMNDEVKDEELLEKVDETVEDAEDVAEEVEENSEPEVEEEVSENAEDINTAEEEGILVEMQNNLGDMCPEEMETAQAAADEQVSEDAVDDESEDEQDAFANVSEMADVNIDGPEEEPHFVHEGEEVRPGVTSEAPDEAATESDKVDFEKFLDKALSNVR